MSVAFLIVCWIGRMSSNGCAEREEGIDLVLSQRSHSYTNRYY